MRFATTTRRPRTRTRSVLLRDVRWETYESILVDLGRQNVRTTYDRGDFELMSPSRLHEQYKEWLGAIIRILAEEFDVDFTSGGSTTLRRRNLKRGLEPDQCVWFGDAARYGGAAARKSPKNSPPNLAIEIDVCSTSVDRMAIYAALQVAEVWRYDGERLTVYRLRESGAYQSADKSSFFPSFPLAEIEEILNSTEYESELSMMRAFRKLARKRAAK